VHAEEPLDDVLIDALYVSAVLEDGACERSDYAAPVLPDYGELYRTAFFIFQVYGVEAVAVMKLSLLGARRGIGSM
jgi:tRNA isopentenyl-2-thiomethyl-A-37 hydroxylase MiaE